MHKQSSGYATSICVNRPIPCIDRVESAIFQLRSPHGDQIKTVRIAPEIGGIAETKGDNGTHLIRIIRAFFQNTHLHTIQYIDLIHKLCRICAVKRCKTPASAEPDQPTVQHSRSNAQTDNSRIPCALLTYAVANSALRILARQTDGIGK